ncbi:hypothetical protein L3X38_010349 [Prunus dulcis]|uniref:Uncharacterized protein n=1 Tax=Prunus dulcis TaxID=3755 RepID=A0AAD4ZE36_PRUDU|nr:hypothetical protein L3X38_010349 [Prunus dulcis]
MKLLCLLTTTILHSDLMMEVVVIIVEVVLAIVAMDIMVDMATMMEDMIMFVEIGVITAEALIEDLTVASVIIALFVNFVTQRAMLLILAIFILNKKINIIMANCHLC